MFWNDGLSKKFAPEHGLFCNIWKYGISFFQKIWYFILMRKIKEHDLYQKTHGNMTFSVYMCGRYKHDMPCWLKKKMSLSRKNTPRGDISGMTKKMIFILENMIFLMKYHIDWRPRKGQYAATKDALQEKVFLELSKNSQEKTCARASFLIKLQT